MGLKTNKATKTSTLNCQYVGSFSVKDGEKNLSLSEQKKFVDAKLKNCTKKLLDGMSVYLQVSPDGIHVMASDEKTVKMAHRLRRVSYATVEPTNKIFAYVTHQSEGDMKVVCHTFITKKKDHAEGLSAALGKLFKQTFAYTLKRRDKLEEAVQKRGAGRRWAKQEVAEGHGNARNAKTKSLDAREVIKTDVTPEPVPQEGLNKEPASASDVNGKPRRRDPPDIPNGSTSPELHDSFTSTTASIHQSPSSQPQPVPQHRLNKEPASASDVNDKPRRRDPPDIPNGSASRELQDSFTSTTASIHQSPSRQPQPVPQHRLNKEHKEPASASDQHGKPRRRDPPEIPNGSASPESQDLFTSTAATIHQSPIHQPSRQPKPVRSQTLPSEWNTPFVPPPPSEQTSPSEDTVFTPSWPNESQQPPVLPSRSHPNKRSSSSDVPPKIPSRDLKRRSSTPSSPQNGHPPPLPNRNNSDSSLGFGSLGTSEVAEEASRRNSGFERQLSVPDLTPSRARPPQRPPRRTNSSEDSSTHPPISRDIENAAAALLATASDTPPPLPRKERQGNQIPPEIEEEEEINCEEDGEIRRGAKAEPRLSLTLEDEDWYIPAVTREIVTEMLEYSDIGTFFVRDSQSRPGCYALTMKVIKSENSPSGFGNYLIAPEADGFALQGFDKIFPDISTLIRHYASIEDGLPCRLILAGSNPLFHDDNGYLVEFMDEEDEMYASLSSCMSMCQELNMNDPW